MDVRLDFVITGEHETICNQENENMDEKKVKHEKEESEDYGFDITDMELDYGFDDREGK